MCTGYLIEYIILIIISYFTADSTFTQADISSDPVVYAPAPLSMPQQAPASPAPPSATPLPTRSQHSTPPAQTSAPRLRYTSGTESDSSSSSYRPPTLPILSLLESDYSDENSISTK